MMLALLIYGYCTGVRSSRKIERATYENVAFRVLEARSELEAEATPARERELAERAAANVGATPEVLSVTQGTEVPAGCGCDTTAPGGTAGLGVSIGLAALVRRRSHPERNCRAIGRMPA